MIKDFNKTAIVTLESEISYTELLQRISLFAQLTPQDTSQETDASKRTKTLILSENREGWIYAFFSIWMNKGIAVPVDAASTVGDIVYILRDCTPDCIWASSDRMETAKQAIAQAGLPTRLLCIDDYERRPLPETPLPVMQGEFPKKDSATTALIIYTSGTTGSPKGVMLSFANLWANIWGVSEDVPIYNSERRALILLPTHHVLPLMGCVIAPIVMGAGVAICPTLTAKDIMDTLCKGAVDIFIGVPRLWQTLYMGIKKQIDAHFVTRMLFNLCSIAHSRTLSRFIFQSIRKKMGGHLAVCVSGGAALDKEIGRGLRTLGFDMLEGYGMTETAPIIAFTRPGDFIPGCAGKALNMVECKIVDGELLAKGPNVMQGYYNRPEETAAVIDKDGFIHTGDLATIDKTGHIYITGRTKEIIVLSNGKNVQPYELEYKLETYDTYVKEAAILPDGDRLKAIIVPQPEWAHDMSDSEVEVQLKDAVLSPYNLSVPNYKKVMSLTVYRGDLPRTRMDKLQRYKLKDIVSGKHREAKEEVKVDEPQTTEYQLLKQFIESEKKMRVRPTDHIETDLAFDSLDKVTLQAFIETTFGMQLNADRMASFKNLQATAEYIAQEKTQVEAGDIDWHQMLNEDTTELRLPSTSPLYPLHTKYLKVFFRLYNRLTIKGEENVPKHGPFILAPNHVSSLDGALAVTGIRWSTVKQCYFYVTESHVKGRLLRLLAQRNNMILMERHNLKNSIMKMAKVLRQGKNIIIFPEGTRSWDGEMGEFKKTFAILSRELQCPIVPVRLTGAFEALPRGHRFIRPVHITVEYMKPVVPAPNMTYEEINAKVKDEINPQPAPSKGK